MSAPKSGAAAPLGPQLPLRAALYLLLFSEDPQKSHAEQTRLKAFAKSQGFVVAAIYLDDRLARRKLKLLLRSARVNSGRFDVVCVLRLGQLATSCAKTARLVLDLGLPVVSAGGTRLDPTNPVVRWVAEENRQHGERIKRTLVAKRARGERVGGIRHGYKVGPDGVMEVPDVYEQGARHDIRRLKHAGFGFRAIARELSVLGYQSRKGTPYTHRQVKRILQTVEEV